MSEPFVFQAGDLVKYFPYGDRVFELKNNPDNTQFTLCIKDGDIFSSFFFDGRAYLNHTHPSIVLVSRPKKKKVKKTYWFASYLLSDKSRRHVSDLYAEEKRMDAVIKKLEIDKFKDIQKHSIEIEEEE